VLKIVKLQYNLATTVFSLQTVVDFKIISALSP